MTKRNLILTGFMGVGKTTVGRIVARRLDMIFVDTDAAIEARAGCTISDIFAERGEPAFRELEAVVCAEEAGRAHQVIATGGGAVLNPQTRDALEEGGLMVCLTAGLETLVGRTRRSSDRPLAGDQARMAALLAARQAVYDSLPNHVDTTGKAPEQVAAEVIALWQQSS